MRDAKVAPVLPRRKVETLIVGAGPAGLQLAYYLQRSGRDYALFDRDGPGAFFRSFPRHGTLISINKVHTGFNDPQLNLRWDWNSLLSDDDSLRFSDFSNNYFPKREALVSYLQAFADCHCLRVESEEQVRRIERATDGFVVATDRETLQASRVVLATGLSLPYIPEIEGIELADSYCNVTLEPASFTNQRVLILGKGNSAFETASHLIEHAASIHVASPNPLRMAWQSRFVGHLRAINNNFLDTYRLKAQNAVIDADVLKLERRDDRIAATFQYIHAAEQETIVYDRVICCTGFRFDSSLFANGCQPATTDCGRLPLQTCEWESTNIEGLYFAGALMQMRDYKRTMSAFIHGFRHNIDALSRILEQKYYGSELPTTRHRKEPFAVAQHIIERVNGSPAMFLQPGFLGDALLVEPDDVRSYRDLPVDWIRERLATEGVEYMLVTLEFGPPAENPFDFTRPHRMDHARASESEALHPVIRHFLGRELTREYHLIEDIEGDWSDREVHLTPLAHWLRERLGDVRHRLRAAD